MGEAVLLALPRGDKPLPEGQRIVPAGDVLLLSLTRRPFPRLAERKGLTNPVGVFLSGYVFREGQPENVLFFDLSLEPRSGAYGRALDTERHRTLIDSVSRMRAASEKCSWTELSSLFLARGSARLDIQACRDALMKRLTPKKNGRIVDIHEEDGEILIGIGQEGEQIDEVLVIPVELRQNLRPWVVPGNRVNAPVVRHLSDSDVVKMCRLLYEEGDYIRLRYLSKNGTLPPIAALDVSLFEAPRIVSPESLEVLSLWNLSPRFQAFLG
jgi:hypothetical protein